jgi:hypothetical protein
MTRSHAEFRLGHLGPAYNAPRYAGRAPVQYDSTQDRFAGHYSKRVTGDDGVRNT